MRPVYMWIQSQTMINEEKFPITTDSLKQKVMKTDTGNCLSQ